MTATALGPLANEAELSSPSQMQDEPLAEIVISGCQQFKHVIPYVIELQKRFKELPRGNANIAGCKTWTEFCETHLDRTPRGVRKAIAAYNEKTAPTPTPAPEWEYIPEFVTKGEAAALYAEMLTHPWTENSDGGSHINYGLSYVNGKDGGGARPDEIPEIPEILRNLADRVSARTGYRVNYVQCHRFSPECSVRPHRDPSGMCVPMIALGQERTFRVGGEMSRAYEPPKAVPQAKRKVELHKPAEEILLQHGSLLIFNGGRTAHSMFPASQDAAFNPNGSEWRITLLFRYTTSSLRKFGAGLQVDVKQYETEARIAPPPVPVHLVDTEPAKPREKAAEIELSLQPLVPFGSGIGVKAASPVTFDVTLYGLTETEIAAFRSLLEGAA